MEQHERTCFRNPQRVCPLCGGQDCHKVRSYSDIHNPVESVGPECPYCLLSVLIRGNTGSDKTDAAYYKKEQLLKDVDNFRSEYLYPYMWIDELNESKAHKFVYPL